MDKHSIEFFHCLTRQYDLIKKRYIGQTLLEIRFELIQHLLIAGKTHQKIFLIY